MNASLKKKLIILVIIVVALVVAFIVTQNRGVDTPAPAGTGSDMDTPAQGGQGYVVQDEVTVDVNIPPDEESASGAAVE
jgi:hypothetical protein